MSGDADPDFDDVRREVDFILLALGYLVLNLGCVMTAAYGAWGPVYPNGFLCFAVSDVLVLVIGGAWARARGTAWWALIVAGCIAIATIALHLWAAVSASAAV